MHPAWLVAIPVCALLGAYCIYRAWRRSTVLSTLERPHAYASDGIVFGLVAFGSLNLAWAVGLGSSALRYFVDHS